jgi:flavodoxin
MKKALIVYQSKKGHTKRYGEEIGKFLQEKGITSKVIAVEEFKADQIENVSCLFLGCWTSGLFLFLQHPDRIWINRIKKISIPPGLKIGLFTTYKIATGSMFRVMKNHINPPADSVIPEWKSKTGLLSESDKISIARFVAG